MNLVVDQVVQLQHVHVANGNRLGVRLTGTAIEQGGLAVGADQTVAVVGSGPAGLAAAQQLTRAGHTVVVYEKDDAIGGLMRYGIPNFKLEKGLLDRRVKQMEAEGTRFRTNVEIGKDITWDDLRDRYDAS